MMRDIRSRGAHPVVKYTDKHLNDQQVMADLLPYSCKKSIKHESQGEF